MGSKGSATQTTQNVNQSYSADPRTQAAAGQALQGAEAAAAQPFQMPVAPVAGFSNDQLSAFQNYQNLAGPNSYLNTAAGYAGQAAAPITANDVNQYYNPMADNVTKQLQNIYGQQNSQNQGMLTAQAGGVGADRIAVGMGDLANQQGLASGQIYSQLYQQALQAAQQQKQMAAGAAGQFGQIEQGALGATGALNAAGTQQQQQTQSELNAPYQNTLARIAYQFQTPQYLAGIAGGLAPALGGQTYGNQVTTPPQPSTLSQVLGIGTAGAGLYGAFGGFGGNPAPDTAYEANLIGRAKGGAVEGYDDGGGTDPMLQFPGASVPKVGNPEAIPMSNLPMGGGHSGMFPGQETHFAQPQQQSNNSNNIGNDIASALGAVAKIAPFLKQGGKVGKYDDGGNVSDRIDDAISQANAMRMEQYTPDQAGKLINTGTFKRNDGAFSPRRTPRPFGINDQSGHSGIPHYDIGGGTNNPDTPTIPPVRNPWILNPSDRRDTSHDNDPPVIMHESPSVSQWRTDTGAAPAVKNYPPLPGATTPATAAPLPNMTQHPGIPFPPAGVSGPYGQLPAASAQHLEKLEKQPKGGGGGGGHAAAAPAAAEDSGFTPPYPDSLNRDAGQNATRSPWMALVQAGATMAATPGPLGVSLGKGMLAGTAALDKQRTELRSEQELNDKAEELHQKAQQHLDKYNKMTAYERAEIGLENRKLDQGESGETPIKFTAMDYERAARHVISLHPGVQDEAQLRPLIEAEVANRKRFLAGKTGAAAAPAGPGSSSANPLPYGQAAPEVGKWYLTPDGKQARQYTGQ